MTPEPIVPHCSGAGPCSCLAPVSGQCEYTTIPLLMLVTVDH